MRLVLSGTSIVLAAAVTLCDLAAIAQAPRPVSSFVAFRVDDRHAVAVIAEVAEQPDSVDPAPVVARFGFEYRDADPAIVAAVPPAVFAVKQWTIHVAPGRRVSATAGRIVHGGIACTGLAGMLLRIDAADQQSYAARSERYFVVDPSDGTKTIPSPALSTPPPAINRTQLESLLGDVLKRELPAVRKEAASENDQALEAGKARLQYDVQAFDLERNGPPRYFVRAEWDVEGRPAFGAALWIRGGGALSIVDQDLNTARWLRMPEFQGKTSPELYGLVLNVFDREGDGWGEVLMARGGYESNKLELIALTPGGFISTGISYSYGC